MNWYLIIKGGQQDIEEAESIEDLVFKYPKEVIAVIRIDEDLIDVIKAKPSTEELDLPF